MSYEGDLVASYNSVHKRLLGSPPIAPNKFPLAKQPPVDKTSLEAFLLRIQALEDENKALKSRMELMEIKTEWKPNLIPHNPQRNTQEVGISIDDIFQLVEAREQFTRTLLISHQRFQRVAAARNIIYYLASNYTPRSLPQIGAFMKRDHTTVLHGKKKIAEQRLVDNELDTKLKWYEVEIARLTEAKNKP